MDCETIQEQLSGLLDGMLDAREGMLVEAHLTACQRCRVRYEELRALDSSLKSAFADDIGTADRIAAGVLARMPATPAVQTASSAGWPWGTALSYLIAMAAGFLLALVWFPPSPAGRQDASTAVEDRSPRPVADEPLVAGAAVAHLVHATGPISYRPPTGSEWEPVDAQRLPVFGCPSEGSVRTSRGALCELETVGGSRIRLNESSEVAFVSDSHLELKQGQIWCQAPQDADLRVVTSDESAAPQSSQILTFSCPTSAGCVTSSVPAQPLQVVSAAGQVEVSVNGQPTILPAGTVATLTNGQLEVAQSAGDLVHAERWMQPLLTLRGHGNPELNERVDALLARIGRTKLAWMYEQDLRNLGEYGALPLLRFVQSEGSRDEPERRHAAIRILADTAPVWMAAELIALLEDGDPFIRTASARGLTRLSGSDQGFPAEDWEREPADLAAGIATWKQWWAQHRLACAPAPAGLVPTWDHVH